MPGSRALLGLSLVLTCVGAVRAETFANRGLARIREATLVLDKEELPGEEAIRNSLASARQNLEQIAVVSADTLTHNSLSKNEELYRARALTLGTENDELMTRAIDTVEVSELDILEKSQIELFLKELGEEQAVDTSALERLSLETVDEDLSAVESDGFDLLDPDRAALFSFYTHRELLQVRMRQLQSRLERRARLQDVALRISVLLEQREQINEEIRSARQLERLSLEDRLRLDQDSLQALQARQPRVHPDSLNLLLLLTEEMSFRLKSVKRQGDLLSWARARENLLNKIAADSAQARELAARAQAEEFPLPPGKVTDSELDRRLRDVRDTLKMLAERAEDLDRRIEETSRDRAVAVSAEAEWSERLKKSTGNEDLGVEEQLSLDKIRESQKQIKDRQNSLRASADSLRAVAPSSPQLATLQTRIEHFKGMVSAARSVRQRFEQVIGRNKDVIVQRRALLEEIAAICTVRVQNIAARLEDLKRRRSDLQVLQQRHAFRLEQLELQKRRRTALWLRQVQPLDGEVSSAVDTVMVSLKGQFSRLGQHGAATALLVLVVAVSSLLAFVIQRRFRQLRRDLVG